MAPLTNQSNFLCESSLEGCPAGPSWTQLDQSSLVGHSPWQGLALLTPSKFKPGWQSSASILQSQILLRGTLLSPHLWIRKYSCHFPFLSTQLTYPKPPFLLSLFPQSSCIGLGKGTQRKLPLDPLSLPPRAPLPTLSVNSNLCRSHSLSFLGPFLPRWFSHTPNWWQV